MFHSHTFIAAQRRKRALEESVRWPELKASSSCLSESVSSQSPLALWSHQLFLLVPLCSNSRRTSAAMNLSLSAEELRVPPKEGHLWSEAHISWRGSKAASSVCHPGKLCKFQKLSEQFSDWGKAEDRSHRAHPCPFKRAPKHPHLRRHSPLPPRY